MMIADWLDMAKADAERRGLRELVPLLEGLAQATERLRAADWNDDAGQQTPVDAAPRRSEGGDFGPRQPA